MISPWILAVTDGSEGTSPWVYLALGIVLLFILVFVIFVMKFFNLWLQAYLTKADVSMFQIIGMWFRKVNPSVIVRGKVMAVQAGLDTQLASTRGLEAHYLAGGHVPNVVRALIAADRADLDLDFKTATGIDLAGRNILEAVQTCVYPRVIDAPDPHKGKETLDAVAKDGIQLRAKARVTVRTNLARLVGGATEETVIARVGESIVSAIGSAETHKAVLENPDMISRAVLTKGLDAQTAFEIVSVDIADVDVGINIGAQLQAAQAEADLKVAKAKAEERRAMAVAREQEMAAQVTENRAKVVLAEAEVPKAMADAFRAGNLGVMDYCQLRNIQADTDMRQGLAPSEGKES
jgi:uncharacterized protein YqfA (UPF0365 family)